MKWPFIIYGVKDVVQDGANHEEQGRAWRIHSGERQEKQDFK